MEPMGSSPHRSAKRKDFGQRPAGEKPVLAGRSCGAARRRWGQTEGSVGAWVRGFWVLGFGVEDLGAIKGY